MPAFFFLVHKHVLYVFVVLPVWVPLKVTWCFLVLPPPPFYNMLVLLLYGAGCLFRVVLFGCPPPTFGAQLNLVGGDFCSRHFTQSHRFFSLVKKKAVQLCLKQLYRSPFCQRLFVGADKAERTKKLQLQVLNSIGKYLRRRHSIRATRIHGWKNTKQLNSLVTIVVCCTISNVVFVGTTRRKH